MWCNSISSKRYDFTASQFREDIVYKDNYSNREEAYADTNERQYSYLKQSVLREIKKTSQCEDKLLL